MLEKYSNKMNYERHFKFFYGVLSFIYLKVWRVVLVNNRLTGD